MPIIGRTRRSHTGFTLIELAVSMFVIALLLGAILVPLATQVEQRQIGETKKVMDEITDALIGFALANGYLPCPDVTSGTGANNGTEDVSAASGTCQTISGTIATGNLPWITLGLGNQDASGNRFRYTVLETFARRAPASPFTLTTTASTLRVCESAACASVLSNTAVAVVISHGSNGSGAMNASTNTQNLPLPTSADELNNTNTSPDIVSRSKSTVAGNEFDDIVTSLSRYTLINRMVAAEKLP